MRLKSKYCICTRAAIFTGTTAVTGCCEWPEVQSCNILFSLVADWAADSETSLVTDGFLMKSVLMIKL